MAALIALLMITAGCGAATAPVLYTDAARQEIAFVAEALLHASSDAHPAVTEARRQIAAVDVRRLAGRCMQPVHYDIDAQSAGTERYPELAEWLRRFDVAMVARVNRLTPGWNVRGNRVMTLVEVRPVEILHDRRAAVRGEAAWTFEAQWGTLRLRDRTLCAEALDGELKAGDVVVIAGTVDPANERHLIVSDDGALRIENGEVIVPSRLNLPGEPRVPLARLRAGEGLQAIVEPL